MRPHTSYILTLLAAATHHVVVTTAGAIPEVVFNLDVPSSHGAVTSEAAECSAIGKDFLARGGNAVDTLVGTTFCIGVVAMYHSGIGGGGFAVIRDANGAYEAIDFRETAPKAAFEGMYQGNVNGSKYGGLAVAVPGEVRGLKYIHGKYGYLKWHEVMQGSICVARDGFKVSTDLEHYINKSIDGMPNFLKEDKIWAEDFAPNGTLVKAGDMMTRKRYAKALERIADEGQEAFYTGEIAEAIVTLVNQTNGTMVVDDLKNYTVCPRPVESISYRGLDLSTIGSPASGAICLSILKTMEQFGPTKPADVNLTTHRLVEAMKFGYGARVQLGDPHYVHDATEIERHLLTEEYAKEIRGKILDNSTQSVDKYYPKKMNAPESHGTSHIVTADKSGMATSLTTTINLLFGAHIMDPKFGIILNNEMDDFDIPKSTEFAFNTSHPNSIHAGKRPLSSITPVIATHPNGTFYVAVGAAGSSRIISATTLALWHVIEEGMTMHEGLREPRWHDDLRNNALYLEYGFISSTAESLRQKGHNVTENDEALTSVQAIRRLSDGVFEAASEPRQNNSAGLTL